MAAVPLRFSDRHRPVYSPDSVLVECPGCGEMARVGLPKGPVDCCCGGWHDRSPLSLTCLACGHSARGPEGVWGRVEMVASGRCGRCGGTVHHSRVGPFRARLAVPCPACSAVSDLPTRPVSRRISVEGEYRGFPLWLRTEVVGHMLWAFDGGHLDRIEEYVAASLRERMPNRNGSFASRLPGWLKQAKHRDAVLTACARLRARIPG